jgi:hypothetical protein
MTTSPRPTRFLRLANGRAVRLAPPYAMAPHRDHVTLTIAPLDASPAAEVDALLPERWTELRDGELRALVAAALKREAALRPHGEYDVPSSR